uniref:Histone-lysine N-methyltransferase, H3 lysine-79 specific n=1 Tax=Onchocerca volvulus TaxID=6282 RepID=A0A8R1XRA3_ONCVO
MSEEEKDSTGHDPDPSTSKYSEESTSSRSSSRSKLSASPACLEEPRVQLKLASPLGGEPLTFMWPLREVSGYSEGQEILDVVRNALSSFPELNFILRQHCGLNLDTIDKRDFQQMSALLDAFNKTCPTFTQLWKGATKPGGEIWSAERANPVLLRQICTRAYNRAVDNVHLLNNHYKAFSSQTYGETSFDRMQMIIQEIVPKDRDVFVDLGSGVGQLVIHMAGGSKIRKAVGIEIASLPNRYAQNLSVEFKKWMKWYGKKFRPFELHKGDFLDEKFRDLITKEATIILINNFAFTAELETRIKRELLSELKDGTRIISTKPYGLPNRTITDRHLNDISAILDVFEMSQCENACSWTSNYVAYYHHVINRAKLEKYFLSQRNPALKQHNSSDGSRRSSTSSKTSRDSFRCWSRESSASLPNSLSGMANRRGATPTVGRSHTPTYHERSPTPLSRNNKHPNSDLSDDDDYATGPTTRRKWQEYCSMKIKSQRTTTSASAENALPVRSSKWPTPDYDYAPSRKIRKTGQRGRPRKIPAASKAFADDETRETIDLMHRMTRTATTHTASPVHDPSLVYVSDISSHPAAMDRNMLDRAVGDDADIATIENKPELLLQQSKYPALNQMLESMRIMFEAQLEKMKAENFADDIRAQIELQKSYRNLLRSRIDAITKQITNLRSSGMNCFYARIEELGIEASTPSLLLENAKEIVAHHKKITAECAALESEITALEMSNQQLEIKVRRREELESAKNANNTAILSNTNTQLLSSLCAANSLVLAENFQALTAHNKNFLNRVTQLADKGDIIGNVAADVSNHGILAQDGLLSPQSDSAILTFSSAPGGFGHHHSSTQSTLTSLSVGATPLKRSRQRQIRNGVAKKPLSGSNKQPSDPKDDEEMERKIQDIVAKALEVDSAAKCAEKERRARGEKRKEKSIIPGTVRPVTDVTLSSVTLLPSSEKSSALPCVPASATVTNESEARISCSTSYTVAKNIESTDSVRSSVDE